MELSHVSLWVVFEDEYVLAALCERLVEVHGGRGLGYAALLVDDRDSARRHDELLLPLLRVVLQGNRGELLLGNRRTGRHCQGRAPTDCGDELADGSSAVSARIDAAGASHEDERPRRAVPMRSTRRVEGRYSDATAAARKAQRGRELLLLCVAEPRGRVLDEAAGVRRISENEIARPRLSERRAPIRHKRCASDHGRDALEHAQSRERPSPGETRSVGGDVEEAGAVDAPEAIPTERGQPEEARRTLERRAWRRRGNAPVSAISVPQTEGTVVQKHPRAPHPTRAHAQLGVQRNQLSA